MISRKKSQLIIILFSALTLLAFCFVLTAVKAQENFEDFSKRQQNEYKDFEKEYEEFEKKEAEAFANYVEEVTRKWNDFKNSTNRDWYEYSNDLNTLSRVDFEEGIITIETIVDKDNEDIMAQAYKNIGNMVTGLFRPDSLTNEIILEGQVGFNSPPIVDSLNVTVFIEEKVLPAASIEKETIKSKDGIERVKITATIAMVPNHLRIRAEKYLPIIRKYCKEYNLDIPLVLAIMQTESFFNPRAKSPVPAFGLMQLVPRYGARDAYRHAHKEDKIVRPNYLYIPENNIHLGCAYLAKMRDNEFSKVTDKDNRRLCLIASYNTGPSNLGAAITGKRKLSSAIAAINEMNEEELFRKLKKDLPYEETRDYLVKVETRRENYAEWQ